MSSENSKRGRKGKISLEEQILVYRRFADALLNGEGKILPATAEIYKTIKPLLEFAMTEKAIQLSVAKNADQIFDSNYIKNQTSPNQAANDEMDVFWQDFDGASISTTLTEADRFSFDLITVKGPIRDHMQVRPGWSDKLFSIIVRETNTDCCYSIDSEFRTKGVCVECDGTVEVVSFQRRSRLSMQITQGNREHTFAQRRRLAKDRALNLIGDLNSNTTHNVHMEIVNGLDDDLDRLPRDFVSHKALENLKYRTSAKNESAIIELRKMKYLPQYGSSIKELCTDPFRIIFWTKEQVFCFIKLKKTQRICISLDATGGVISRASILQDINKYFDEPPNIPHIFLYLICVKSDTGPSVPVGQMLSAQQDTITINYFLSRWLLEFGQPDELVCDDSAALIKATVLSFTQFKNVGDYIDRCFMVLCNKTDDLPECYIRLDIPHFISSLSRNKVFSKIDSRLKHYYMSVMGVIIQCEEYQAIKNIIKNVLVLANYPVLGKFENEELPTEQALQNINAIITTHDTSYLEDDGTEQCDVYEVGNGENIKWFDEMLQSIESDVKKNNLQNAQKKHLLSSNLNWYYFPEINSFLRLHLSHLPLWSAVMRNHFESKHLMGNSTDIESRFNLLKNNVFRNVRLPVRADIFVKKFITESNAVAKLGRLLSASTTTDQNGNDLSTLELSKIETKEQKRPIELSPEESDGETMEYTSAEFSLKNPKLSVIYEV